VLQFCCPEWGQRTAHHTTLSFESLPVTPLGAAVSVNSDASMNIRITSTVLETLPPHLLIRSAQCTKVLRLVQEMMYHGNMNLCELKTFDPENPFCLQDLSELFMFCQQYDLLSWLSEFVPFLNAAICYYALGAAAMVETVTVYNEFIHWLVMIHPAGILDSVCLACVIYSQNRWGLPPCLDDSPVHTLWLLRLMCTIPRRSAHIIEPQLIDPPSKTANHELPPARYTARRFPLAENLQSRSVSPVLMEPGRFYKDVMMAHTVGTDQPSTSTNTTSTSKHNVSFDDADDDISDNDCPPRKRHCLPLRYSLTKHSSPISTPSPTSPPAVRVSPAAKLTTDAALTVPAACIKHKPHWQHSFEPVPRVSIMAPMRPQPLDTCEYCVQFRPGFRRSFFQNTEHYVCCNPKTSICIPCTAHQKIYKK
jgi:hypothetical protein